MRNVIGKYTFNDMCAMYVNDEQGRTELVLVPAGAEDKVCLDKAGRTDSLIQFMVEGDATSTGYSQGHTERNSESVDKLVYKGQDTFTDGCKATVKTYFAYEDKLEITHSLTHVEGAKALVSNVTVKNIGTDEISLTSLASFSLGMLTPFAQDETFNRMNYYRVRSKWSSEGKVESGMIEDFQLEPNWGRHGISVEKYGQIGSLPVRKFFPIGAIEDKEAGVVWAAQLAIGSSWQMEFYRKDESLCMSGGLPDFEFGHFMRTLKAGDEFQTPNAYLTVCEADFDYAAQRLLDCHSVSELFRGEGKRLPYVFNEYCTTWGNPSHENITNIVNTVKGKGFDYFMIDAGWYSAGDIGWEHNMGDWEIADNLFPEGLKATVDVIRNAGMKPGIWFELEVVGKLAKALAYKDHILKKHGKIIMSGERFFWDMRDEWTKDYLKKKVIDFLNEYGFEYIKIDYNESIGVGCDGAESLGSALYDVILASQEFYREIHRCVPGICIELCSSGGHRLEPSFLNITDMASFSDAHEPLEIPVIAGNLHRVMRPEKSQIWCVVREDDTPKRLCYSICNALLGVLCISGDVLNLTDRQWQLIDEGAAFYRSIDGLIKDGISEYFGPKQVNYRKLEGYQGVLRKAADGSEAYLIINSFSDNQNISIDLSGNYEIANVLEERKHDITVKDGLLNIKVEEALEGIAILLKKAD